MSDIKKEGLYHWLVKDKDGEYISVFADAFECGGNGLKFEVNKEPVAWFTSWQHFRKII